ncbi:ADP-ribose pyrophosphatase YjhB (NUDIX family) [Saccharothrix coeruleofusca]|nr:ADP-ribose pyrophosphatase YjhB (NUDIX family) [Saccharothrix coeruleofusca]
MADNLGTRPVVGRLAADVVLFTRRSGALSVLVVERGGEPFRAALALPGGFVEPGERPPDAAVRELAEETGVVLPRERLRRLGCYREPGRDPRGHVVSVVYHGYLAGAPVVTGGSDARAARWVGVLDFMAPGARVAFDHRRIVGDAVFRRFGWRLAAWGPVGAASPGAAGGRAPGGRAPRDDRPDPRSGCRSAPGSPPPR